MSREFYNQKKSSHTLDERRKAESNALDQASYYSQTSATASLPDGGRVEVTVDQDTWNYRWKSSEAIVYDKNGRVLEKRRHRYSRP